MASYAARTKELFKKYGRVAVGVHFAVYFTGLGGESGVFFPFLSANPFFSLMFKNVPKNSLVSSCSPPHTKQHHHQQQQTPTACYVAVERGVKVDKFLRSWGLMGEKKVKERAEGGSAAGGVGSTSTSSSSPPSSSSGIHEEEEEDERSWFARALSGRGSSLALAFVANKALFPVRAPITLGLTPAVARALRANAANAASSASASAGRGASASESSSSRSSSMRSNGGSSSGSSAVSDTK